ncbi:exonuclease domain-containing protein [Chitinibacteraceae bacterium HSL-7]
MTHYYAEPLVLVDLETTGANPARDRITEIGIVEVGSDGVRPYSQLVNPQQPIVPFIEKLTGISDAMVADAPLFADVAADVRLRLGNAIFVAHNARFDYGFLKAEFKRIGLPFRARVLCTVKLSKLLYPDEYKHSLDAIVARHGLVHHGARHRALTDAELLLQFLDAAIAGLGRERVHAAIAELTRGPALPAGIDPAVVDDLPEGAGVYLFYGDNDAPLYVGKSGNVRRRVLSHFSGSGSKEIKIAQAIRRLDWLETAGEFGALLEESRLVKTLQPLYNVRLRRSRELCAWRLDDVDGLLRPRLVAMDEIDFSASRDFVFGPFASKRDASKVLERIADGTGLCRQVLGLEGKGRKVEPCFAVQLGRCRGVCCGKEAPATHNARLLTALSKHAFAAWPFAGPVGIPEGPEWAPALHVIDRWCYLGTIHDESELPDLLAAASPQFDLDTYKLIRSEIKRRNGQVRALSPHSAK